MKVIFVIRKGKKRGDSQVPIEMTICVKGKRRYVSTGHFVKPKDFSAKKQTVKGDKDLNEFLQALRTRILSIETTLLNKGVYVTIDTETPVSTDVSWCFYCLMRPEKQRIDVHTHEKKLHQGW